MNKSKIIIPVLALICYSEMSNASSRTLEQYIKSSSDNRSIISQAYQDAFISQDNIKTEFNSQFTAYLQQNPQTIGNVMNANGIIVDVVKTTLKSPLSGFSYALAFAVDLNNSSGAIKFSYGLSKAKFHSVELLYNLRRNFTLGYAFIYGSGDNKATIKNRIDNDQTNVDIKNKQELLSAMMNLYYQIPLSQYIDYNIGVGLGIAGHNHKLDTTRSGTEISYKDHHNAFAYRGSLGGKFRLSNAASIELNYNMNGFGSKKKSIYLNDSFDNIEVNKSNVNHEIVLGLRVLL